MLNRFLFATAAAMIAATSLHAADAPEPAPVQLTRAAGPVTIDGTLSEPAWQQAARFDTWYETNPGDNVAPKVKSAGYVMYDDRFLYIAIDMFDPNPSQIRAVYGDHDNISGNSDDFAGVLLDTRDDRKTGYELFVTARGTQYDAIMDDAVGNEDSSPDFFWDSAAKINDHGWAVEMRIPFSSLRYRSSDPSRWGLVLYRNYPRDRRYQIFTVRLPRGGNCFVCHFASVTGLQGLPSGGHIVAAPYLTAKQVGDLRDDLGSPLRTHPATSETGADLKWTPNADTAIDATLNPDFSQVESDVAAITANERFAIFYPEKRPFFLEGVELFNTPIQAVYTRTITAPRWGARTTGKIGSNAYTLLVAQDGGGGSVILPSATGSDFANQDFRSTAAIARVRHDFDGASFVSLLATTREAAGSHNRVIGPDFQWKNENSTVTGQFLVSDTKTPNDPTAATEWDGRSLRSHAGDLWYQFSTKTFDFYTEYKDYGEGFRANNGFVPQVGYRSNYAETGRTFWPEKRFFSRIRTFGMAQYDSTQDGAMLYRKMSAGVGADGKYRSFSRIRFAVDRVRTGDRLLTRHQLFYDTNFTVSRVVPQISLSTSIGQDVDFTRSRLGRGANVQVGVALRPTDHLEVTLHNGVRWLSVAPVEGERARLFTAQVERLRATYTFNSRTFVRAVVQNQRTNRNQDLYGMVDPETGKSVISTHSGSVASQLLFAYKINWQTLMFVGIGDLREATADQGQLYPAQRQVFLKLSYAFQR